MSRSWTIGLLPVVPKNVKRPREHRWRVEKMAHTEWDMFRITGFFKLINVSSEWTVYSPEGTKSSSILTQHECLHLCNVSIRVSAFESPNLDSSNVLFSVKTCSILSFLPPVSVGWLWVAHPAVKRALGVTRVKWKTMGKKTGSVFVEACRRRAPSPWTVLSVSLSVMWALISSGKGFSFRWRRAAKSGCFVFDQNLPVKPRNGSESHTVAIFKAIPGRMSCLNRFVLWWATGISDATPKRKPLVQKPLIGHGTQRPWPLTSADTL